MKQLVVTFLLVPLALAETTGDVRDVRVIRTAEQESRASLLGQPSIALWKENHLVFAYQKGIAGKTDMGSIDAIVSRDDGHSWSMPSTFFDAGIHNSCPTLIEIAPSEYRAVWDSGDAKRHRRSIRFGKLTL